MWSSGAGALQGALRLQHDRAVDHSAVELGGAGRCGLGGEHAPGPVERLRARREGGVDRRDLARMDAQLGAEAVARATTQVGAAGCASSSSCGVTPATGAAGPRRAKRSRARWRHARGHRGRRRCPGRGRARSRACRRPGATTPSAPATSATFATPRALSISASTRAPGTARTNGLHLRR